MAAELGKFISEQLKTLPKNHPDRKFLKRELLVVKEEELYKKWYSMDFDTDEMKVKQLLRKYIALDYDRHGHLSGDRQKYNEDVKKREIEKYGEKSIVSLLPSDSSLFGKIIPRLFSWGIHTKQDLNDSVFKFGNKDILTTCSGSVNVCMHDEVIKRDITEIGNLECSVKSLMLRIAHIECDEERLVEPQGKSGLN